MNFSTKLRCGAPKATKLHPKVASCIQSYQASTPVAQTILVVFQFEDTLTPYKLFRRSVQTLVEAIVVYLKLRGALKIPELFNTPPIQQYLSDRLGVVSSSESVCLLIDDNMYYRSMRYPYYQLARKCKIINKFVVVLVCVLELDLVSRIELLQLVKLFNTSYNAMYNILTAPRSHQLRLT